MELRIFMRTLAEIMSVFIETRLDKFKQLACGLMFGSAVGVAAFSPVEMKLGGYYRFSMILFTFSAVMFGHLHRVVIITNGYIGILGLTIVAILMLLARPAPQDFLPFLPMSVATGLLLLVFVVPWMQLQLLSRQPLTRENLFNAHAGPYSVPSNEATYVPLSSRSSTGHSQTGLPNFFHADPSDFQHMGPESFSHQSPQSSDSGTNIDLEAGFRIANPAGLGLI